MKKSKKIVVHFEAKETYGWIRKKKKKYKFLVYNVRNKDLLNHFTLSKDLTK